MADIGAILVNGQDVPAKKRRARPAALQPYGKHKRPLSLTCGGQTFACTIVDLSLSGASLATTARFRVGTPVEMGRMRAVVTRHHETGLAVSFVSHADLGALARHFGLIELASLMGC